MFVSGILSLLLCFYSDATTMYQPGAISAKTLINSLSAGKEKVWYQCGKFKDGDQRPGDKRLVFAKTGMKLTIQTCNNSLKWQTDSVCNWGIRYRDPDLGAGYKNYYLLINSRPVNFNMTENENVLYVQLSSRSPSLCFR